MSLKKLLLNVLYKEINLNVPNKMEKRFDLHYPYENTKGSLVGVQKTKQSKEEKRQQEQFGNYPVI